MPTGSVTVDGSVTGQLTGTRTIGPLTLTSSAAQAQTTQVVLANGFNTITVPSTSCVCAVIAFAAASTVTKTLKGVTGDTGIVLATTGFAVLTWVSGSAPATFGITTSGADTGNTTEILFF